MLLWMSFRTNVDCDCDCKGGRGADQLVCCVLLGNEKKELMSVSGAPSKSHCLLSR